MSSIIHHEIINPDAENKIILIGGLTRDHTVWRKIIPCLAEHYCVITCDNRDAGQSPCDFSEDYTIEDMSNDIAELIEHIGGPVHLVGHSMGGFMGFYLAANHPELIASLTLCSTTDKQSDTGANYLQDRINLLSESPDQSTADKKDIEAMLPKLYYEQNLTDPNFVKDIVDFESQNPHPQTSPSFIRQAKACIAHDARDILDQIQCPVLVTTGKFDPYYTPSESEELATKLNGEFSEIPNAAHMIQIEQPELLCKAINQFIQSLTSTLRATL